MGMLLAMVLTAGSITQTAAPVLITVEEARCMMPTNIDVTSSIRNTENVRPTISAVNLARSLMSSLRASVRMPRTENSDPPGLQQVQASNHRRRSDLSGLADFTLFRAQESKPWHSQNLESHKRACRNRCILP